MRRRTNAENRGGTPQLVSLLHRRASLPTLIILRFDWPELTIEQINDHQSLHSKEGISTVERMQKLMKGSLDYRVFTEFCGPNQNKVLDPYVAAPKAPKAPKAA